ncbi:DUF6685 family protein [Cronobacter sakazakii]|uniref:DUF6685 family protein n=1 Tax=Cronobacter sakazakii TaxID=28141 RepID=UPI0034E2EDAD
MEKESGSGPLNAPYEECRPALWERLVYSLWKDVRHLAGYPEQLKQAISLGALRPVTLQPPPDTFWMRSVVRWDTWMNGTYCESACTLNYRSPGYDRRFESSAILVPELQELVCRETVDNFSCDITDVSGMAASKSVDYDIQDIDQFPELCAPEYISPVSELRLANNLTHRGIRWDEMRFADYSWTSRRLYWLNCDGSHHLAAARYLAVRTGKSVPLNGTLYRYTLKPDAVKKLQRNWYIFAVPDEEIFHTFYDAMEGFQCPFGHSVLPENLHAAQSCKDMLALIWLPRWQPKTASVAQLLARAGFPDFNHVLSRHALQTTIN